MAASNGSLKSGSGYPPSAKPGIPSPTVGASSWGIKTGGFRRATPITHSGASSGGLKFGGLMWEDQVVGRKPTNMFGLVPHTFLTWRSNIWNPET